MDQAFFRRARRLLDGHTPAGLDHRLLVDTVTTRQALSPTAQRLARQGAYASGGGSGREPVVDLLLGAQGWREAAVAQRGCFSRPLSKRLRNEP